MARTWLSIRVELISGHGADLWPRPGRVFAAARSHSFARFATAIDIAFGRWDLAHLHLFTLSDGTQVSPPGLVGRRGPGRHRGRPCHQAEQAAGRRAVRARIES
ncbi:hypothetical protein [Streptomyces sp. NPDC046942]|uniref:hypothetical protein n=1 Tax=Streptomyces sp. NPDC046942 TaxID=3155137 RepID=UPI0033F58C28